jgi:hypothetical protein
MAPPGEGLPEEYRQGVMSTAVGGPARPASEVLSQRVGRAQPQSQVLDELMIALHSNANRTKLSPPPPVDVPPAGGGARPLSAVNPYGAVPIGAPLPAAPPAGAAVPLGPPGPGPPRSPPRAASPAAAAPLPPSPAFAAHTGTDAGKPAPTERLGERPASRDREAPGNPGGEEPARAAGHVREAPPVEHGNGEVAGDRAGDDTSPKENGDHCHS